MKKVLVIVGILAGVLSSMGAEGGCDNNSRNDTDVDRIMVVGKSGKPCQSKYVANGKMLETQAVYRNGKRGQAISICVSTETFNRNTLGSEMKN